MDAPTAASRCPPASSPPGGARCQLSGEAVTAPPSVSSQRRSGGCGPVRIGPNGRRWPAGHGKCRGGTGMWPAEQSSHPPGRAFRCLRTDAGKVAPLLRLATVALVQRHVMAAEDRLVVGRANPGRQRILGWLTPPAKNLGEVNERRNSYRYNVADRLIATASRSMGAPSSPIFGARCLQLQLESEHGRQP